MLNCFILKAELSIRNLPVIYDEENIYDEFAFCNKRVIIDSNVQISDSDKELINNYTYAQESLNDFYKKTNAIPDLGYNRNPSTLIKIVELMTDSDENPTRAIEQYNLNLREEQARDEQRRREELERQQSGYYDSSSSGGFLSSVLSTAAGVAIGNRASQRKQSKKQSLWGTAMCPWGQKAKKYDSSAPDFMTIRCNISCPMYTQCGGKD